MSPVEQPPIGPYTPVRLLGEGSTTYTYLYRHEQRRRYAVFKVIREPLSTAEVKEEFVAHAKLLKKLIHRNIIAVQDYGLHPAGVPDQHYGFLVMQYMESQPISKRFVEGESTPPDEIRRILLSLTEALQYATATHMVHGNLHPGNILQTEKDVFLTDFSLPSFGRETSLERSSSAFLYRAPEHLKGQEVSTASDQYALAVMAYEWLCGRRPYLAATPEELLARQEHDPLPVPGGFNPQISPLVAAVLLQALAYNPQERFPQPQAFSDAYRNALMGRPPIVVARTSPPIVVSAGSAPSAPPAEQEYQVTVAASKPKKGAGSQASAVPSVQTSQASEDAVLPKMSRQSAPPVSLPLTNQNLAEQLRQEVAAEPVHERVSSAPLSIVRERKAEKLPESEPEISEQPDRSSLSLAPGDLQRRVEFDLRQGGVLSRALPGYEERPAQIEMAGLVARSISENTPAIIEASTGTGKALDVDTPVPTPTGWKRMGDLQVGDRVFDEQGQQTTVTVAFDIMYERPCYEVVFSDGSSLIADAEHEWASYTAADRLWDGHPPRFDAHQEKKPVVLEELIVLEPGAPSYKESVASVEEAAAFVRGHPKSIACTIRTIAPPGANRRPARYNQLTLSAMVRERFAKEPGRQRGKDQAYTLVTTKQMAATLTAGASQRANHAIALAGRLTLPEADLPLAPYFLGAWLGEGGSYSNQVAGAAPEILREIEKAGYTVRPLQSQKPQFVVDDEHGKAAKRWQPGMAGRLRALNVIQNKHIPPIYLRASAKQRRALLAGLLDMAGTVKLDGAVEFTTTHPQLAQDIYELLCSLGFLPSLREGITCLKGADCEPEWTLAFTTAQEIFRLEYKAVAQKERLRNHGLQHNRFRYVVAVNPVPSRPVRCIQVAAPSHLYLAGRSMIPTHNSLAYLISVVRSGKVAIVSTANKALQEQLFFKDIPFIQKYIRRIDAALVKGMGNYICLDRVEQERIGFQHYVKNRDFMRLLELIEESDERFTGDFEMLGFTLPPDIRSKVNADRDQCTWSKCSYYADCYVHKMKTRASQASVIVVNHTLLLLDAFMEGKLLPERDVIVVDEAHHLEEEATRAFTTTISPGQVATLLAQGMLKNNTPLSLQDETKATMNLAWEGLERVADPGSKGRANLKDPLQEGLGLASMVEKLVDALRAGRPKDLDEKDEQLYEKLITRAQNLASDIRIVFSVNQLEKYVYYVESVKTGRRGESRQLEVSAAPLEVTSWLKEQLFDKSNVICTSATLATIGPDPARPEVKGPNFAYFRRRAGLDHESYPDVQERILPLTFDYEGHALLYLPRHIPEPAYGDSPAARGYIKAIGHEMMRLVEASRGRAFLLFSSKRMMDEVFNMFSNELPVHLKYPLLRQGDMTRMELVRSFREREGAVLFGLKSFWEGVDIAGEALSLVVIDKLPFDPPDDPVHEARVSQMKAAGENWFGTFVLPQTVLRLKQGLGRLLRTHDDRGVMAILDTRLYSKSYGKQIVLALPPARRVFSMDAVVRFFQEPDDDDEAPF